MRTHPQPAPHGPSRRGVVLLVVITLLTLFTVVGLSFVYYAEAEATSSKLFRESTDLTRPDVEPELALSYFLGKLIYGEIDDESGVYSAARGHDLARGVWGFRYFVNASGQVVMASGQAPFTGTGRLHYRYPVDPTTPAGLLDANNAGNPADDYELINYLFFQADGFLRDPERVYFRQDAMGNNWPYIRTSSTASLGNYTGGYNAPWTYPDLNNMYLGAVLADGTLITPSFHREYLFGRLDSVPPVPGLALANTNPYWINGIGKYRTLRPRPVDQLTNADVLNINATVPAASQLPTPWTGSAAQLDGLTDPQKLTLLSLISSLQSQGKLFPYPKDRGGDVKNLRGGPSSNGVWNDSVWVDFGMPVMTAKDGRKFKILFAPLIIDLDGKLNLNIHGSPLGTGNQGWTRAEVNLALAFPATSSELTNLFTSGRLYGASAPTGTLNATPTGPWYALTDLNGDDGAPTLPVATTSSPFPTFGANYGNGTTAAETTANVNKFDYWNSGGADISPTSGNRVLPLSNLEALYRYQDKNSPALGSDLFRLMPTTFSATPGNRGLVTLRSFDLTLPGLAPWVWDPANSGGWRYDTKTSAYVADTTVAGYYSYTTATGYPRGTQIPFPALQQRIATAPPPNPPAGSDFDSTWMALATSLAANGRMDLNRALPDYPAVDAASVVTLDKKNNITSAGMITDNAGFQKAQSARQAFAQDIYTLLLKVTGTRDPNTAASPAASASETLTARWLAQLAVNIVDYVDNDDYITPFNWLTDANGVPLDTVYGTELPRLVLNEAYAEVDNDKTDTTTNGKATNYYLNAWVELFNPFNQTTAGASYPRDNGTAFLQNWVPGMTPTSYPVYQVYLLQPGATSVSDLADFTKTNPTGDPTVAGFTKLGVVSNWGSTYGVQDRVFPAAGATSDPKQLNNGYYVLGPAATPARDPQLPAATYTVSDFSKKYGLTDNIPSGVVFMLQRLACPHRAPDSNLTIQAKDSNGKLITIPNPNYNPYITVDYFTQKNAAGNNDMVTVNDNRVFDGNGPVANMNTFATVGRRQPYNAFDTANQQTTPPPDPKNPPPVVQQTFFQANNPRPTTNGGAYDWLVHLDRPLSSPLELLMVSINRPHMLTHQFYRNTTNTNHFNHCLDLACMDGNSRLYRFFELVRTGDLSPGLNYTMRMPGNININTIWNQEVWQALFGTGTGAPAFTQLTAANSRTPSLSFGPTDHHMTDTAATALGYTLNRPFRALSTGPTAATVAGTSGGQYPMPTGIDNTILRSDPNNTNNRLLENTGSTHPYLRYRDLGRAFNTLTTRSNVFAIFLTVGFFEVRDDTTRPVKLGAEIGRLENRHIRHRLFAVVDRTDLRRVEAKITPPSGTSIAAGQVVTYNASEALTGQTQLTMPTLNGNYFVVQPGDQLVLDPNTVNEEVVTITSTNPGATPPTFSFTPARSHTAGSDGKIAAMFRGHPGPWPGYNPRVDRRVVPHFSVID